ncbi:beta-lactamase/transpeptidase-like protein [Dichomitus squalens]|uniref:Beta-lactamase/transpeptidase-like protein n=1 Tax=Dichomitus squalens TaxID=114155 RepID=A0A4Q9PNR4_9APHY|nr:beta-lactamase/transpeptidase-like protein [Dichomitus squalens]TBU55866.1 beta-lactamase/transpeptidase-like protein [Dichomitus squalens]
MRASVIALWLSGLVPRVVVLTTAQTSGEQAAFYVPHSSGRVITPAVSAFIEDALATSTIPGLALGVVRLDENRQHMVELEAWGRQTEEGDGDDLTPDALFAIASCSKSFLVTSLGLLMDDFAQGRNVTPLPSGILRFDWDTKVRDLLPDEWSLHDEWAEVSFSLRDAFSHLSGLPRHDFSYKPGDTATEVLWRLRHLLPAYEPREQWMYNNQMYMVGAHIVSRLSNMSYQSFASSRIFAPLHMNSTTFSPSKAAKTGRLTQTWTRGVRRVPFWFSDEVADLFAGAGGIISSAEDVTKWLAVLLNKGVDPLTTATIIPASVLEAMTTTRAVVSGIPEGPLSIIGYGMGWFRMAYKGHDVVWHFGAIPGFSLLVAFLPRGNLGVVLLANMDEKQENNMKILYRVIDEALGQPQNAEDEVSVPDTFRYNIPAVPGQGGIGSEPLPLTLDAYAGTYEDPLYGSITFCSPLSTSEYCIRVLEDFASVDSSLHSPSSPSLLAAWPRVWSSHVRLRHSTGTTFALIFPRLFPQGYGKNTTPFEFYDSQISVGRVKFVVEGKEDERRVVGFSLITDEQAAAARVARSQRGVREVGDAWFTKTIS